MPGDNGNAVPPLDKAAAEAVALPGWEWRPGMLLLPFAGGLACASRLSDDPDEYDWPHDLGLRAPDLRDDATGGVLLALLTPPEAWGHIAMVTPSRRKDDPWLIQVCANEGGSLVASGQTLAHACAVMAARLGCWPGGAP